MASYPRTKRIGEEIRKIVSTILLGGIKDPRVTSLVSVIDVDVTTDLKYAYVYVSILSSDKESTLKGLKSASGFIRREIGKSIKLRYTPEIVFKLDETIEQALHMSNLIREINSNKKEDEDE